MDKLHISKVINDMTFQHNNNPNNNQNNNINNDNNNNNNNINNIDDNNNDNNNNNNNDNNKKLNNDSIKNSIIFLEEINNSIKKDISQSVIDLTNCFICLSPTNDPLTCPKCNNFACKKCLEKYFEGKKEKKCPLCKRLIKLSELKENKIVEDIENILNKKEDKVIKYNELSALIEQKKNSWVDQTNNISHLIEKIFKYQDKLQKYKKEYDIFISNSQKLIEETFDDIIKKTENLINSLLSYNTVVDNSIKQYDNIYNNSIKKNYNSSNFKQLINEILSLERKKFNTSQNSDAEQFLNTPIKVVPSINTYNVKKISFKMNNFFNSSTKDFAGNHFKIGDYNIKYYFSANKGFHIDCTLTFNVKEYSKKMCFLLSQIVELKDKKEIMFPMVLLKKEGMKYHYMSTISCEEFNYLKNNDEFSVKTEALIFTI